MIKIKKKKHSKSYKVKTIKIVQIPLVCIKDVVTKQVIRLPQPTAKTLVDKLEHMQYATKREWRYYLHDQKEKGELRQPNTYWKDKPETIKDEEDKEIVTQTYLPKINPKDRKSILTRDRGLSRRQRREWKHRRKPMSFDMYTKFQTIIIEPQYEKKVYKLNVNVNPTVFRKHKKTEELIEKPNKRRNKYLNTLDLNKSKVKYEKFEIKQQVFDNCYITRIFSSEKQPEKTPILRMDGSPAVKKIYTKQRVETVTIEQPSRTTYKTIITKQYPSVISNRRHVVKKNIDLLRKEQEKQSKNNQNEEKNKS